MRAWLYDRLTTSVALQSHLGGADGIVDRVMPRRSQQLVPKVRPFLIYGLGNSTDLDLTDSSSGDAQAERQFFQVWVHDEGGSYLVVDELCRLVKGRLEGASSPADRVLQVIYLETSSEFSNETYGTIFRYIRFQAVQTRGA